ncbi:hypothetical protein DPMN_055248 [Dreissena polymorpha]|uniref:Uncharacterized protein n=1 Tax=Dreissena polymorpha TaxID=45954 RepID=A0A9D4HSC7_DREPO|nr:hypothetical protein DPMN_055248 [Dreissena polymorpha]
MGKSGYFLKGKLQVKDKPVEPNASRTFQSHTQPVSEDLHRTKHANAPRGSAAIVIRPTPV